MDSEPAVGRDPNYRKAQRGMIERLSCCRYTTCLATRRESNPDLHHGKGVLPIGSWAEIVARDRSLADERALPADEDFGSDPTRFRCSPDRQSVGIVSCRRGLDAITAEEVRVGRGFQRAGSVRDGHQDPRECTTHTLTTWCRSITLPARQSAVGRGRFDQWPVGSLPLTQTPFWFQSRRARTSAAA